METVPPCQTRVPSGVILEDGLSEDEAVLAALSKTPPFKQHSRSLVQLVAMPCKRRCSRTLNS